jgi:hypothetical protein
MAARHPWRTRKTVEEQASLVVSAEDLRAERARQRIPVYKLAAIVSVHPGRLSRMLNEQIKMPEDVARRVAEVLKRA